MKDIEVRLATWMRQAEADAKPRVDEILANRLKLKSRQPRAKKPWPTACDLHVPMEKICRNRLLAQTLLALFTAKPVFNVKAVRPDDDDKARKVEQFMEALFTSVFPLERTMDTVLNAAIDDGTGIAYEAWRRDTVSRVRRKQQPRVEQFTDEMTGETMEAPTGEMEWAESSEPEVLYDGPDIQYIPIEKFYVYPATASDVQSALGCWFAAPMTGSELRVLEGQGKVSSKALATLAKWTGDFNARSSADATARSIHDTPQTEPEFESRTFEIRRVYWRLPVASGKPLIDFFLLYHEPTRTILSAQENPHWHKQRPFTLFRPFPDKTGIYGDGMPDLVGEMGDALTTLLRQTIDQASIDIHPPIAVNTTLIDPSYAQDNWKFGPGQMWFVTDQNAVTPLYHPSQVQIGTGTFQFVRQLVSETTANSENVMGAVGPHTQTATEIQSQMANAGALFALIINRFRESMARLADLVESDCYEFASNEAVTSIWQRLFPDEENVFAGATDVLAARYRFYAAGSSEGANKELTKAVAREVVANLLQNPLILQDISALRRVTRWYLAEMGVREPDALLPSDQDIQQAQAMQAAAQQTIAQSEDVRQQAQMGALPAPEDMMAQMPLDAGMAEGVML